MNGSVGCTCSCYYCASVFGVGVLATLYGHHSYTKCMFDTTQVLDVVAKIWARSSHFGILI